MNLEVEFSLVWISMFRYRQKWRIATWPQGIYIAFKFPEDQGSGEEPYLYIRWLDCGVEETQKWTPQDEHFSSKDWEEYDGEY